MLYRTAHTMPPTMMQQEGCCKKKKRTIWWTPCATHCLDIMLEDIGKIEWAKECVEQTKSIPHTSTITHEF